MSPDFPLIIADESVDARVIRSLTDKGYPVFSVSLESPGIADVMVIQIAHSKKGFILTEDKDFGDELVFKKTQNTGSMLIRLSGLPIDMRIHLVLETLTTHGKDLLGSFSVLSSKKLRIRKYQL